MRSRRPLRPSPGIPFLQIPEGGADLSTPEDELDRELLERIRRDEETAARLFGIPPDVLNADPVGVSCTEHRMSSPHREPVIHLAARRRNVVELADRGERVVAFDGFECPICADRALRLQVILPRSELCARREGVTCPTCNAALTIEIEVVLEESEP